MTSPRHYRGAIKRATEALVAKFGEEPPEVAVIFGSGLGGLEKRLQEVSELPYSQIPEFPPTTVPGHTGTAFLGQLGPKRVLTFSGRFHYYEGHSLPIVTLPVRTLGAWGVKKLIVTNAAASLQTDWSPGSLVFISDHLNLIGQNPLRGPNLEEYGPRFFDMTTAYDAEARSRAKKIAIELKIPWQEGTYAALPGPTYETKAEIKMLANFGADLVGMSVVPEVIVARHHGMQVLGISCVANLAAGIDDTASSITHDEVLAATAGAKAQLLDLIERWIAEA